MMNLLENFFWWEIMLQCLWCNSPDYIVVIVNVMLLTSFLLLVMDRGVISVCHVFTIQSVHAVGWCDQPFGAIVCFRCVPCCGLRSTGSSFPVTALLRTSSSSGSTRPCPGWPNSPVSESRSAITVNHRCALY